LKEGEALRYKGNGALKYPEKNATVYVYHVFNEPKTFESDDGNPIRRYDFTALIERGEDNKSILEYLLDSRYFERVEG